MKILHSNNDKIHVQVTKFCALNFRCLDHPQRFLTVNFYQFTVFVIFLEITV